MSTKKKKTNTIKPLVLQTTEIKTNKNIEKSEQNSNSDLKQKNPKKKFKIFSSSSSSSADEDAPINLVSKSKESNDSDEINPSPIILDSSSDNEEDEIENDDNIEDDNQQKEVWFPTIEYETIYRIYEYFNKNIPITSILCTIHQCYGNIEEALYKMANGQVDKDINQIVDKHKKPNMEKELKYYS